MTWKQTAKGSDSENPATGNISYTTPAPTTSSNCDPSSYSSELAFQLQETDDGNTYFCIVSDNTGEQSRKKFTIGKPGSPQTASDGSSIVTILAVGIVFSVIIGALIYFYVIQKKKQPDGKPEDKSKKVEGTDVW
uniref:Ig-like domain-containing protein n=1 Tax=Biomphalaria glabrata TaxID=6526 RepID=A0A2C9KMT0_BIOGL